MSDQAKASMENRSGRYGWGGVSGSLRNLKGFVSLVSLVRSPGGCM